MWGLTGNLFDGPGDAPHAALPVSDPGAQAGQPFEIAVLALQNLTLFPETVIPLAVGRPASTAAVEAALSTQEKLLACVTVRPDAADDTDAKTSDLYEVGTLVMIETDGARSRCDAHCGSGYRAHQGG